MNANTKRWIPDAREQQPSKATRPNDPAVTAAMAAASEAANKSPTPDADEEEAAEAARKSPTPEADASDADAAEEVAGEAASTSPTTPDSTVVNSPADSVTPRAVCGAFLGRFGDDIVCDSDCTFYVWDERRDHTWTRFDRKGMRSRVFTMVSGDVHESLRQQGATAKELAQFDRALDASVRWIMHHLVSKRSPSRLHFDLEHATKHLFQFRNGAFNLKTSQLEPRTKVMYITKCLPYDYSPEQDASKKAELDAFMARLLPDEEARLGVLAWRGYCLTGETKEQCFVLHRGKTGNGKSTLCKMFQCAFGIYCRKIGADAFNKGNAAAYNKTFGALAGEPLRLVFMEEWGGDPVDVDRLKATVEGNSLTVQPPYKAEQVLRIQFKVEASSNHHNPNTSGITDAGLVRRGRLIDYTSVFVDEPAQVDESNQTFLKENVDALMVDDTSKLALFHLLAPHAKAYYQQGLRLPAKWKDDFEAALGGGGDVWTRFFAQHVRPADGTAVFKEEALATVQKVVGSADWCTVKHQFAAHGYRYNPGKQKMVKRTRFKGAFEGCQLC